MSELDDLGDIADQMSASVHGFRMGLSPARGPGRTPQVACGSDQHMKPPNIRFYKDPSGRRRNTCKLCDKVRGRRRRKSGYSAEGYPL